jgi:hypothetical protein
MQQEYKMLMGWYKEIRDGWPEATRLRIHRALSGQKAAERSDKLVRLDPANLIYKIARDAS